MSPPRKPKTLDTDEGARKPSQKVAIDEVLRSLQDLVQNELSTDGLQPAASARGKTTAKKEPPLPPAEPDFPDGFPSMDGMEEEDITLEALPDSEPEPVRPATKSMPGKPPGGLQQELPHLDPPSPGHPASKKPLEIAEDPPLSLDGFESAEDEIVAAPAPADESDPFSISLETSASAAEPDPFSVAFETPTPESAHPTAPDNAGHGDIPILDDAVDLADVFHAQAAPQPGPLDAHRIAVQVAARLNIELRREGKPVLSSEVMARLTHVLEEALAKGGPNMENTSPD